MTPTSFALAFFLMLGVICVILYAAWRERQPLRAPASFERREGAPLRPPGVFRIVRSRVAIPVSEPRSGVRPATPRTDRAAAPIANRSMLPFSIVRRSLAPDARCLVCGGFIRECGGRHG